MRVSAATRTPASPGWRLGFILPFRPLLHCQMSKPPAATQDAVFELLGSAATYGAGAAPPVTRHQTHAAIVFLAGDRALKVKRAVRYPFLDFSSLDKRKDACEAELEINRKFAPQLYRRVVPITRQSDGTLALGGDGEPVEWAVEMVRFDEDKTLDRLAERGELDDRLIDKLAIAVAAMHERAERVEPARWITALEQFARNNTSIFKRHPDLFEESALANLEQQSFAALDRLRPLLIERGEQGLIRRGHGDLHLGNIAVLNGEPAAFDALEFDPVIASGDLLYDLAFLLMDLVGFGRDADANKVLNGYYAATRRNADYDGIAALPFFMSLRAAIRAMATVSRLDVRNVAVAQAARRYFNLALKLLSPSKPKLLGVGGLSGTGKSVWRGRSPRCLHQCQARWCFAPMLNAKRFMASRQFNACRQTPTAQKFRKWCIGPSLTKRRAWRAPVTRRLSMRSLPSPKNAPHSKPPRQMWARSFAAFSSLPTWQRACAGSARAHRTLRMRTPMSCASKKNSQPARSPGDVSTPRARRRKHSLGPARRSAN
jgi:aminoglycoside phosphotransferase family enzyme